MSVDRLSNASAPMASLIGNDRAGLERLKADELAREFESMLLLQMLRQMRQSMTDETEEEKGLSADTMVDMVDGELARQLSKSGGFGLADIMRKAIERQLPGAGAAPVDASDTRTARVQISTPASVVRPTPPGGEPDPSRETIGTNRLSSNYGWRSDPFTGHAKYHQGIDVKASYGQEVPAAADGRVIEAGERGAYGQTVVVEHGNGLKTRYAHMSAMTVSVGDRVLQGQEIGRVGQSGRATGPHLHFEVIRNGQCVDPTAIVALQGPGLDGLKLAGAFADSPIGGRAHTPAMSGVDDED